MDEQAISFGPYRLLAAQRLLLEGDTGETRRKQPIQMAKERAT